MTELPRHSREQLGPATGDESLGGDDQTLANAISALGHETKLLKEPHSVLGDCVAHFAGSPAGEHWNGYEYAFFLQQDQNLLSQVV